jgi:hypothetical protein
LRGVLVRLRSRGERAGGAGARRGLCEGMRVCGGGAETDGVCGCLGGGSYGVLCCGVRGGRYEGDWCNGKKHGEGIYTFASKDR